MDTATDRVGMFLSAVGAYVRCCNKSCLWSALLSIWFSFIGCDLSLSLSVCFVFRGDICRYLLFLPLILPTTNARIITINISFSFFYRCPFGSFVLLSFSQLLSCNLSGLMACAYSTFRIQYVGIALPSLLTAVANVLSRSLPQSLSL